MAISRRRRRWSDDARTRKSLTIEVRYRLRTYLDMLVLQDLSWWVNNVGLLNLSSFRAFQFTPLSFHLFTFYLLSFRFQHLSRNVFILLSIQRHAGILGKHFRLLYCRVNVSSFSCHQQERNFTSPLSSDAHNFLSHVSLIIYDVNIAFIWWHCQMLFFLLSSPVFEARRERE